MRRVRLELILVVPHADVALVFEGRVLEVHDLEVRAGLERSAIKLGRLCCDGGRASRVCGAGRAMDREVFGV